MPDDAHDSATFMHLTLAHILGHGGNRNAVATLLAARFAPLPEHIYLSPYVASVIALAVGEGFVRQLLEDDVAREEVDAHLPTCLVGVRLALLRMNTALAVRAHPDHAATLDAEQCATAVADATILDMLLQDPHTYIRLGPDGGLTCARWEVVH